MTMAESNLGAMSQTTEDLILRILPESTTEDVTLDAKKFTATGILARGNVELGRGMFTIRNDHLSDDEKRDTIQWYLEKHATHDPFDVTRAEEARRILKTLSHNLAEDIATLEGFVKRDANYLKVQFYCPVEGHCPLAAFPWEILEDKMPWANAGVFHKTYYVERVVGLPKEAEEASQAQSSGLTGKLNILMVTARRPSGRKLDIKSGQVSWPLAKVISKYPGAKDSASLHLVRPGSWSALVRQLETKEKGFYQLVHLDMHGQIEEDCFTLSFTKPNNRRRSKIQKVAADRVASLLVEHGVRIAVVNACESSKVLQSGSLAANMAHIFVRHGLEAAIAMSYNAMDSTTEFFVGLLYTHLIIFEDSLETALKKARAKLYETDNREVTLAETVSIADFFVPTLYRSPKFRPGNFKAPGRLIDLESKSLSELFQHLTGFTSFLEPSELVGRSEDVSEIETLMEICPILLLHGPGGTGKTELLRHLMWWWPATSLVRRVVHVDLAEAATVVVCTGEGEGDNLIAEDMDERRIALLIRKIIRKPQDGTEAMRTLISDFFDEHSCLLIVDSLEMLEESSNKEHDRLVRELFERLVEKNEGGFTAGNSFVILSSRRDSIFGWDASGDIAGYRLSGLPLYHALRYGHRVLRRLYGKDGPRFKDDHSTKAHLEHVVQILDGNPLAIEIVFPIFGYSDAAPSWVVQQLLTSSAVPPAEGQLGGQILERWAETETGMHARFVQDVIHTLNTSQKAHDGDRMEEFVLLLGLWNCVFPRAMDAQLIYFLARARAGSNELPVQRAELSMMAEKSLGDITLFPRDKVEGILSDLVREGMIFPIRKKTLLVKKYDTEYYAIHPVLTLYLRVFLNNFIEAAGAFGRHMGMSLVGYRLLFDSMHARHCTENLVPTHQHDDEKIRSFEENGRWNFVAAIIHATHFCNGKPIEPNTISPVSRLVTVMSSLMGDYPEVTAIIRAHLSAELVRHLKSDLIDKDEAVLYGAVKLAFTMKDGAPLRTWQLIEHTMDCVDRYRATGKAFSGYLEVSYMETRTTGAASAIEQDRKLAVHLFERNLRYEPCSNDSALQSIKRDVLRNLRHWVMLMMVQPANDESEVKWPPPADDNSAGILSEQKMTSGEKKRKETEKTEWEVEEAALDERVGGGKGNAKASSSSGLFGLGPKGSELPQPDIDFVQEWWSDSVRKATFFDHLPASIQQHALQTFSSFAVSILEGPQWAAVTDLAPDAAALLAFHSDELSHFRKSSYEVALRAHIHTQDGNTEALRRVYREGLERQMREANDAVTNIFIHQELEKVAILEGQWLTAARHLENQIKLSPGGGLFSAYIKLAQCYEKADMAGKARVAAICAHDSVRTHPSTPDGERGRRVVMSCNQAICNLAGVKDFSFVSPKRRIRSLEGGVSMAEKEEDDKIHLIVLLWDDLFLSYGLPGNVPDGKRLREIVEAVTEYEKVVAQIAEDEVRLRPRQEYISPRLDKILADIVGIVAELEDVVGNDISHEEGDEERKAVGYAEAEKDLFAKEKLDRMS